MLLLIIVIVIVLWYFSSPQFKGKVGETKVNLVLASSFAYSKHYLFSDIIVKYNGETTQIDHVVISKRGVFVIETKNYSGWIFGNERQKQWTQVIYRKKYYFQNPLNQNYKHKLAIQKILGIDESKIISLVVFTNKSEFKTIMPYNVVQLGELRRFLKFHKDIVFDDYQVDLLAERLKTARLDKTLINKITHIKNVRAKNRFRQTNWF